MRLNKNLSATLIAILALSACGKQNISFSGGPADGHDYQWYVSHQTEDKAEVSYCSIQMDKLATNILSAQGVNTDGMKDKQLGNNLTPEQADNLRKKVPNYCFNAIQANNNSNFIKPAEGHY